MNKLLALFFLSAGPTLAQSPFDGTWIINWDKMQLPEKVSEYRLTAGMIHCVGCIANVSITTDGHDQKLPAGSYWDTASARIIDQRSVEITIKKAGKTLFTETDTVSPDGRTLTQSVKDTTEAEAVIIDTLNRRVSNGPAGSHTISGTWRAYKENRSKNGSIIKYKCTADGFSAETPLGEKVDAKFDGKYYLLEDDPGHTMVSVKLVNPNTVEQTFKRDGQIGAMLRLTVMRDGKTIHAVYENKEDNTTKTWEMQKQPQ